MHGEEQDRPHPRHVRPPGVDDATVEALGRLSEALETAQVARGHLYAFHQLTGRSDAQLGEAAAMLRAAGHEELAAGLEEEVVGRNVLPGYWTFQIVEAYDATYHGPFTEAEESVRRALVGDREHLYEAEMKERHRTHGHPDHTARPPEE